MTLEYECEIIVNNCPTCIDLLVSQLDQTASVVYAFENFGTIHIVCRVIDLDTTQIESVCHDTLSSAGFTGYAIQVVLLHS